MATPTFCTPSQVAEFLNLTLDVVDAPEVSTVNVQRRINTASIKLASTFKLHYGDYPLPTLTEPATNIQLVMELMTILQVASELVLAKADDLNTEGFARALKKQSKTFKRMLAPILKDFKAEDLDYMVLDAIEHRPLSIAPFATVEDCELDTPGFTADENANNGARRSAIERHILRYTAWVRARAVLNGYEQDINKLTPEQAEIYREQVALWVRAYVVLARARQEGYNENTDLVVNTLLDEAEATKTAFDQDDYLDLFQ